LTADVIIRTDTLLKGGLTQEMAGKAKVGICPTCGRPLKRGLLIPTLIGGVVGLGVGVAFVALYFGTYPGFFHNMALVHEAAGTVLGLLGGLIAGSLRR
jgi:hypothetical protein